MSLRIGETQQPAKASTKKSTPQKQNQNFVIDFTDLPKNLRTADIRKKFDKDGDGFLESKNSKGQNELYIMEKTMGLDLSKYKKAGSVTSRLDSATDIDWNPISVSTAKLADGTIIELTGSGYENGQKMGDTDRISKEAFNNGYERSVTKNNKTVTKLYDKNGNLKANESTEEKNVTYKGQKGFTKISCENEDGTISEYYSRGNLASREDSEYASKDYRYVSIIKDKDGNVLSVYDVGTDSKTVDKSGYGQVKTYENYKKETETLFDNKKSKNILLKVSENKNDNESESYLLNGKKVNVTKSTNGRYEITQDGKTEYYSSQGVLLRQDYVNASETKYSDGRSVKVSPNGKTTWYFVNGKSVTKNEFYKDKPFEVHTDNNGKTYYTVMGEKVKAKPIANGRYEVTKSNGKKDIYSHDGKLLRQSYLQAEKNKQNQSAWDKISCYFK